jgi:type II secretory pathway component GspD/PulD (secretin)
MARHLGASFLAATLLLTLQCQPGWAGSGLTVAVRPAPVGAQVILSAPAPLRFTLRHLSAPDRLVADLFGPATGRLSGTQQIALPPVRSVRLAPGQGFVQVVIELTGPVLADVEVDADGKRLRLLLRPAAGAAGPSRAPAPAAPAPPAPVPPSPAPLSAIEVIRLQHARARDVAGHLAALLPGLMVRADEEANSLILSGPADRLAQAKALLQQMDAPSPSAPASELVRVRAADPEALARALRQAVPGLVVTADRALSALILQGSRADVDRAKALLAALEAQPATPAAGLRVEVIPLRHALPSEFVTEPATSRSAEDLAQTVQAALQPIHPEMRIAVERRTQALIVTGTAAAVEAARELIGRLDQPSAQVALEVRVMEVAATALANLGISLSPIVGTTLTEPDPNQRPFQFGRTPLNITLILNLLVEQGKAKVLATPTVATLDGRKALIRTGDDIPLVTRQIFGGIVIENVVTFRAGVTLEILPKISPEGTIAVILRPVVSTITGTTPQGLPQISTREVQTTLVVRDGETIVIGGLLEERDIVSMSRIPWLGDLPVLGRLFRSERREQRRTELVITVTPRILPAAPAPSLPAPPPAGP